MNIDHSAQDSFETWLDGWSPKPEIRSGHQPAQRVSGKLQKRPSEHDPSPADRRRCADGIALLNLCNLLAAKAVSRKQEFAVYESLGMTGRQLTCLLALEGLLYAALCFLVVGPPTSCLPASSCRMWSITTLGRRLIPSPSPPLCIILPVILLLSLAVPLLCLHFLRKGSIRQRMADYDFK